MLNPIWWSLIMSDGVRWAAHQMVAPWLPMSDISGRPDPAFALPAFLPALLADSPRLGTNWWVDICPQGQWVSALVHFRCRELSGYWGGIQGGVPGGTWGQWVLAGKGLLRGGHRYRHCCAPNLDESFRAMQPRCVVVIVEDCSTGWCARGGNWNGNSIVRSPRPTRLDQPFQHWARSPIFLSKYFHPNIFIQIFSSKYFPCSVRSSLPFYLVGSFWSFSVVFGLFRFYLAPF